MAIHYLLNRRLRHLRSLSLYNVAVTLEVGTSIHSENETRVPGKLVRYLPCYFIIENLEGELLFVSEIQQSSLRQLRFNDVNFEGDSTSVFTLKIVAQLSKRYFGTKDDDWCIIATIHVDLNNLQPYDPDSDVIESLNVPVFSMDDGHYTIGGAKLKKSIKPATFVGISGSNVPSKAKRSFDYHMLLRINKLLDYLDQTQEEINTATHEIEAQMQNTLRTNTWLKESVTESERWLKKTILQKREEALKLQSKLSSVTSIHLSGVEVEPSPYEPVIDAAKDDYGTTYSRLSQAKDYFCYLRLKKLNHLIDIFGGVGILTQCSHDGIEFTDSSKEAIKLLQVDVDVGSKSKDEPNTNNGKQLSFKKLNYSKIIAKLEASELSVSEMNTCLGYLVLLLQVIASSVFRTSLPCKLMYYGSTSVIENSYPLFLPEPYSVQNLLLFKQALQCLNINILQVQQYLDHQYSLGISPPLN